MENILLFKNCSVIPDTTTLKLKALDHMFWKSLRFIVGIYGPNPSSEPFIHEITCLAEIINNQLYARPRNIQTCMAVIDGLSPRQNYGAFHREDYQAFERLLGEN